MQHSKGRCLVTGASRGIGRAIAIKLAEENYQVIIHGRNQQAVNETVEIISKSGRRAEMVIADLATPDGVDKLARAVSGEPLQLLVNNAGVAYVKPFTQVTTSEWNQTLAVNVTAPFLLVKQLLPAMPEGASIVNILSVAARTGFPNWSSYSMSKFALEGFTQSLRKELRPRGIRVINIYPSATRTEMWRTVEGDWPAERMISPQEVAEAVYFAVSRPANILVENMSIGDITGTL